MPEHKVIGGLSERIRDTVLESDVDITVAAKRMGISRSTLYGYMYYEITPSALNLIKIASWFDVSTDWLLGISNQKHDTNWITEANTKRDTKIDKVAMGKSIKKFRKSKGISRIKLARLLGVGDKSIYNWEMGRFVPLPSNQEALKSMGWEGFE